VGPMSKASNASNTPDAPEPPEPPEPPARRARVERRTRETEIAVEIDLDGRGRSAISTPLPFLSHMLDQVARHGLFDLTVEARGDVEIDGHHTTEDCGITLGQAVLAALGDKKGLARYGDATLPMDEALVTAALDLSGRPFFVSRIPLPKAKLGTWDVELCPVFFEGFARGAQANLHLRLHEGENLHHIVEITFKAFAKALSRATRLEPRALDVLPSTKGSL
jgi:imidazoleglycerol-phosphate dehydratase